MTETRSARLWPQREVLLLFATILFALAVRSGARAGAPALLGTVLLAAALFSTRDVGDVTSPPSDAWNTRLLLSVITLGLLGVLGWSPSAIGPSSWGLERMPGVIWIALALATFIVGRHGRRVLVLGIVVLTVGATLLFGSLHLRAAAGIGLDVYFLHVEAADALSHGLNPYTDAVRVPNGSPTAEPGDEITGYVYPPVTAISYSLGYWAFGDPRFTSLIAWSAFLALLGVGAARRRSQSGLLTMLLIASTPGWPLVLRAAWTEPLSLALIAAAFTLWRSSIGSGLLAGLALASKQYFLVGAPLLLHRDRSWIMRTLVVAASVIGTLGIVAIWDLGAFWASAVEFHLSTPPRADGANLVGLASLLGVSWDPPALLAVGVGLGAAVVAVRSSVHRTGFVLALGTALGASFLVSSQAFANYWFLIAGLCGLALMGGFDPPGKTPTSQRQTSSDDLGPVDESARS